MPRHPPCALKNLATDARVHYAVLKQRPATRQTKTGANQGNKQTPIPSGPNSVPNTPTKGAKSQRSTHEQPPPDKLPLPTVEKAPVAGYMLLRKEVIQPHLPVRLPCYDFVPIASPTFDSSPPKRVGPPASGVTDFRDVTGGVYKARERIHRSVADLRLLATPTSWGRVADPNPN